MGQNELPVLALSLACLAHGSHRVRRLHAWLGGLLQAQPPPWAWQLVWEVCGSVAEGEHQPCVNLHNSSVDPGLGFTAGENLVCALGHPGNGVEGV